MAVAKDLVPLKVVKNWSKRLVKAWPEVSGQSTPKLSVCQEAIARALGHNNWHDLQVAYEDKDQTASGKEDVTEDARLFLTQQIVYAQKKGWRRLVWKTQKGSSLLSGGDGDGYYTPMCEVAGGFTKKCMDYIFKLVAEGADIGFYPESTTVTGTGQFLMGDNETLLPFIMKTTPSANGFVAQIDLLGATHQEKMPIEKFPLKGVCILAADEDGLKKELMTHTMKSMHGKRKILLITNSLNHQISSMADEDLTVIPMVYRSDSGEPVTRVGALLDRTRAMDHDVVIVNEKLNPESLQEIMGHRHKNKLTIITMNASDTLDVLFQLDQHKVLDDWLRYGLLSKIVTVESFAGIKTPDWLTLDDHITKMLQNSPPQEWKRDVERSTKK